MPDGKCSYSQRIRVEKLTSTPPTRHVDLRAFWSPRMTEKKVATTSTAAYISSSTKLDSQIFLAETIASASVSAHGARKQRQQQGLNGSLQPESLQSAKPVLPEHDDSSSGYTTTNKGLPSPESMTGKWQDNSDVASIPNSIASRDDGGRTRGPPKSADQTATDDSISAPAVMDNINASSQLQTTSQSVGGSATVSPSQEPENNLDLGSQKMNDTVTDGVQPLDLIPDQNELPAHLGEPATSKEESSGRESPRHSFSNEDENRHAPMIKAKRRLTLHGSDIQQPARKKQRGKVLAPAGGKKHKTVQTTLALAIGGSAGMRECKVCDTVYNPFHPEDVKVHAKRHAGVLKKHVASG